MSGRSSITAGRRSLGAAGEDTDGATVVRAGGERAADGELDVRGAVLAREQQHVDHLPRRPPTARSAR